MWVRNYHNQKIQKKSKYSFCLRFISYFWAVYSLVAINQQNDSKREVFALLLQFFRFFFSVEDEEDEVLLRRRRRVVNGTQ